MQNPTLTQIANRIAAETLAAWWKLEQEGTSLCAPHLSQALGALTAVETEHCGTALVTQLGKRAGHLLPLQRQVAVRALAHLSHATTHQRQVWPLLKQALQDRHPQVRETAAEAIGHALLACDGEPGLLEALTILLQTDAPAIRITAARALVALLSRPHTRCAAWLRQQLPSLMASDARTRYALEIALGAAGLQANGEAWPASTSARIGPAPPGSGPLSSGVKAATAGASSLFPARDKFSAKFSKEQVLRLLETLHGSDRAQRQKAALLLAQAMRQNVRVYRHNNTWILRSLNHDAEQPFSSGADDNRRSAL